MRAFASRRQRHRGWVQRCVTPGAVESVIEASGMSVEPEHGFDDGHGGAALDAMRARILGMQRRVVDRLPGGLAFLAGLPSRSPLRIAVTETSTASSRGMASWSQKRPGAAAALEPYAILGKPQISARFAV